MSYPYPILNLSLLTEVLEGIWSSELRHQQREYFCGTSACVAGWSILLHMYGENIKPGVIFEKLVDLEHSPYATAKSILGLSYLEADLIFHHTSNRVIHEKVLNRLSSGNRIEYDFIKYLSFVHHYKDLEGFSHDLKVHIERKAGDYRSVENYYMNPGTEFIISLRKDKDTAQSLSNYLQLPVCLTSTEHATLLPQTIESTSSLKERRTVPVRVSI